SLLGASVPPTPSCTVTVTVQGTTAGVKNNSVQVASTNAGNGNTASASITVVAPPTISKAFGAASIPLNGTTSMTFTITNPNTTTLTVVAPPTISKAFGAANIPLNSTTTVTFIITNPAANTVAESGIAFSDTLTNGLQVASTPGVTNSCGGTVTAAANSTSISLTGGSIATPGATCTIVVNVTGTQSGTVTNTTGAVSSTNGGTGATSNTATLIVASPATVTKTFAPTKIPLNGTTLLTINITNPNSN